MKKRIAMIFLGLFVALSTFAQVKRHNKIIKLMGSRFEITAIHEDAQTAWDGINAAIAEISRIEKLISSWDPNSQTSEINKNAGIRSVRVDKELYELINRSIRLSNLTDGAFDITFASMDRIWKFDGSMTEMPTEEVVKQAASKINYKNIVLVDVNSTVYLKERGMKIGFGGIGKGYAALKAKEAMMAIGIENGVVNAAGDLIAWGKQENGEPFNVGVADPKNKEHIMSWLNINNGAIVTSGDYERFVSFNGKRYAHIIDPRTGYPTTGIKSVTVICPNPELADALATSVFILGKTQGLALINQLFGIECLIVTDEDKIITSKNLETNKS